AMLTRNCKILVVPGALSLDVIGPLDVFTMAARLWAHRRSWDPAFDDGARAPVDGMRPAVIDEQPAIYAIELISERGGPVVSSSGLPLFTSRPTHAVVEPFDTLMVAGGTPQGILAALDSPALAQEIVRLAALARRVTSVCTGAFLLAGAG